MDISEHRKQFRRETASKRPPLSTEQADSGNIGADSEAGMPSHSATKGLFAHIQSNNAKSVFVFIVFLFLVQVVQFAIMVMLVPVERGHYVKGPLITDEMVMPSAKFQKIGEGPSGINKAGKFATKENLPVLETIARDLDIIWDALVKKGKIYEGHSLWIFIPTLLYVLGGAWFASVFVRRQTGASRVTQHQEPRLFKLVEGLTLARGLPMPAIEVIESDGRNAYASGFHPRNSAIGVSRGLLNALNDAELEAVLAHEVAHIEGRDNRLMTFANLCTGAVSSAGRNLLETSSENPIRVFIMALFIFAIVSVTKVTLCLALIFGAWGLAELVRMVISQKREFIADARAIEIMKSPAALISALLKVARNDRISGINSDVQAMMISNLSDTGSATHPAIAARIKAIEETTSVNSADISSIALQPNRTDWGGQQNVEQGHPALESGGFGQRVQSDKTASENEGPLLEDARLERTYTLLTGLDRNIVKFTKMTAKIFAFSPLLMWFLAPLIIVAVTIEGITGLPWPIAAGLLVGAIVWRRSRRQQA